MSFNKNLLHLNKVQIIPQAPILIEDKFCEFWMTFRSVDNQSVSRYIASYEIAGLFFLYTHEVKMEKTTMKAFNSRIQPASRYLPGDPLLESVRISPLDFNNTVIVVVAPPKEEDIPPAVKDIMTSLKFTPEEIKDFMEGIKTAGQIVGGIVSVVGAVTSVIDIMTKLGIFGDVQDKTQTKLDHIGARVDQIYTYLKNDAINSLDLKAVGWRSKLSLARNSLRNAQLAPTPEILSDLVARTSEVDDALNLMLDPKYGKIPFLRSVYGYVPGQTHWIDAATPTFMNLTNGDPITNYADPASELQTEIWDPGYYIDVLFRSLAERLLLAVTVEPAFRSTGFDRGQLKLLVQELTVFIDTWRSAMLVANPEAGLNGGVLKLFPSMPKIPAPGAGILQSPYRPFGDVIGNHSAPEGIVVGAVDPVMGVVAWEPWFDRFDMLKTSYRSDFSAWGGTYDVVRAKDPPMALATAQKQQVEDLDEVVLGSGIAELVKLRAQFQLAASQVSGSEFVHLQNAYFRLVKQGIRFDGSPIFAIRKGGVESMDLGGLAPFAQDPHKEYKGTRYYQEVEKSFSFRAALRTRRTRIQLGYRLRIGSTDITLVPFSNGGYVVGDLPPFPTETINVEIHETAQVYNVRQSHVFSFAEEDLFEAGEPIPGPVSAWENPGWRGRLFMDERMGEVALAVEVRFEHDQTGQQYTGEIFVTIRNLDPEHFPHGVILPIQVFETHMDDNTPSQPYEDVADSMTVHIVPSFMVMSQDYFDAYWETVEFMGKTVKDLNDRFAIQERVTGRPNPDPAWAVRRQVLETVALVNTIDAIKSKQPEVVAEAMQQFRPPVLQETG